MASHKNFLQATTTTEGTGDITLVDKVRFPNFDHALSATDTIEYSIDNGNQWECGLGTYNGSNVLERTTIYATWDGTTYDDTSPTAITLSGSSTVYGVNTAQNIDAPTVDSLTVNTAGHLVVPSTNDATTPTIAFGDGDTGFYESSDDVLRIAVAGAQKVAFATTFMQVSSMAIPYEVPSATNPSICPDAGDFDTGIGHAAADALSHIAGGIEAVRYTEASSHVLHDSEMHTGLTASTTQSQGNGVLLSSHNEVSTVANTNDTVTLPSVTAGRECIIINNGANTLQIFPASGEDLGAGANISTVLEPNESISFRGYSSTQWHVEAETQLFHAEMHDQDNTDAYVVNDAGGDFHAYHTNGMAAGDLAGWTFDAGGAGTSFPIASIADAGGGDITVTTTGTHGLAVGDIVSQTNLADAAYVGLFVVQTVPSTTTYTVTATYTATGTGTMDQAATLECSGIAAGVYKIEYHCSATSAVNNETFDFELCHADSTTVTTITGSKMRRKFGTGGDYGAFSGGAVKSFGSGDKVAFALSNQDTAGDLTIRNLTIIPIRL